MTNNKSFKDNFLKTKTLAVIVLAGFVLAACGVRGTPQIPPPIWGDANTEQAPSDEDPFKKKDQEDEF